MNTWVPSGFVVGFGLLISLFFCVVLFVFVLCLVCPNLSATYLAIFTHFIFICVCSLSRMWRTRVTCFKDNHILGQKVCPYLHVQHEQIISLPFHEDRHIVLEGLLLLMILLHILIQQCSGCYLFIFWHRLIISAMKVCYYQTVGEVASLPSDHWSQGQIDFGGIFVSGMQYFYPLT
jgi:hypothetical protein